MKTILLLAAAMGFTVSVAAADCAGHAKTTSVDTDTKVASLTTKPPVADSEEDKAD
jgi:hypothetical protein